MDPETTRTFCAGGLVALALVPLAEFIIRLLLFRKPKIKLQPMTGTCQSCKFVGYPVAGVIPNHGHCRRFAPATGLRGADRWPIIELPATVCGDYQAGPVITLNVPDDEHP